MSSAQPSSEPNPAAGVASAAGAPRKRAPVSIFQQKKKPVRRPPPSQAPNGSKRPTSTNGNVGAGNAAQPDDSRKFVEYPIFVTKSALMEGRHHHAMKLQTRSKEDGTPTEVDPYNKEHFTRPLHLHRRSARDKVENAEQSEAASGAEENEREIMNIRRAQRQAEREKNQALIAPMGGNQRRRGKKKTSKKVEDVYFDENDPKQRQRAKLRYEEARPWHLEDFDRKNVWVGSYEEPLSNTSVLFELGSDGFKMVPVEKWYRFSQTNRVEVMPLEKAEELMAKKYKAPRWFLGTQAANDEERKRIAVAQREAQRIQMRGGDDDDVKPFVKNEEFQADVDEIDFEFDGEFQDDDEGMMFGDQQDEDAKEIERKIREEMRTANLGGTGVKDEDRDWDEEEQNEQRKEQEEKRKTRRMRKQLIKKERKNEYDSESDHGEFSEEDESEDSEEEREKLEEEKKQEESRKANADKSGASTKESNTPSGRAEKRDSSRQGTSLKRPGSPELSEMSGNESSRKRAKGVNGNAVAATSAGGSRPLSPGAAKHTLSRKITGGGYGSGSDTDASRRGRPKARLANSPGGSPKKGTPAGSRAASPEQLLPFPTQQEVSDAIPSEGIAITELVKLFKRRVNKRTKDFIDLVKVAGVQDSASKRIKPKPGTPATPALGGDEEKKA